MSAPRTTLVSACALAAAALVCAQTSVRPAFEVASIRPSDPGAPAQFTAGLHIDGAQVSCVRLSLRDYIRIAYRVKDFQISGPDWLRSERFDIAAKLPEGGTREQVPDMLQALLEDRFQLKTHRDRKEFPVYRLEMGKTPLALKESPPDPVSPDSTGAPADPVPDGINVTAIGGRGGVNINLGRGASFAVSPRGIDARRVTMAVFADNLARFTDRPIVDLTGLKGTYDLSLPLEPEDFRAMLVRSALNAGVELPPQALHALDEGSDAALLTSIQKLGLKLEPGKAPLGTLVIDRIEKTPGDN